MKRPAFTIVEIFIVVVILGILAAIVIPQFTVVSEQDRKHAELAAEQLRQRDMPEAQAKAQTDCTCQGCTNASEHR